MFSPASFLCPQSNRMFQNCVVEEPSVVLQLDWEQPGSEPENMRICGTHTFDSSKGNFTPSVVKSSEA